MTATINGNVVPMTRYTRPSLGVAVCGLGFAGRLHARAAHMSASLCGPDIPEIRLVAVADIDAGPAEAVARRIPGCRAVRTWRELAEAPEVDAVVVALPNHLHAAACVDLLTAGKALLLEKPMATTMAEAITIADTARRLEGHVSLGYVFLTSPAVALARALVADGAIGDPVHLALHHQEDYGVAPAAGAPGWRADSRTAGFGALGDLGAHALSVGLALCGPVSRVTALMGRSPEAAGGGGDTDDVATALLDFVSGAQGTLQASRVAIGRKMRLGFELYGTAGSLVFDHERPNEIAVCRAGGGFERRLIGPDDPHYALLMPAAGHGLGFADLFTIQIVQWARTLTSGRPPVADLTFGLCVEAGLHAIAKAARERRWITPAEMTPRAEVAAW